MKVKDVPVGELFTIDETPSYPKLKTLSGWVDIRDEIVGGKNGHGSDFESRLMDLQEVMSEFNKNKFIDPKPTETQVKNHINRLKQLYF